MTRTITQTGTDFISSVEFASSTLASAQTIDIGDAFPSQTVLILLTGSGAVETINGGTAGSIIMIGLSGAATATLIPVTGNLALNGNRTWDPSTYSGEDFILLLRTSTGWVEMARGGNSLGWMSSGWSITLACNTTFSGSVFGSKQSFDIAGSTTPTIPAGLVLEMTDSSSPTTVTSFTTPANRVIILLDNGSGATIEHDGTDIILNGGSSWTPAANDILVLYSIASGKVVEICRSDNS